MPAMGAQAQAWMTLWEPGLASFSVLGQCQGTQTQPCHPQNLQIGPCLSCLGFLWEEAGGPGARSPGRTCCSTPA